MEQGGQGSDPHPLGYPSDLHCAHCGAAIVDESSLEGTAERPFCCHNCAMAA